MINSSMDHSDHVARSHKDASVIYPVLFSILFMFGLVAVAFSRLAGKRTDGGLIMAARQEAHAVAGYALKY